METLIDEIILSKKNTDKDFVKKSKYSEGSSSTVEKLLMRNIESIKKLADKEGVDMDKLIKHLKIGE